jgi:hypothetical protein
VQGNQAKGTPFFGYKNKRTRTAPNV